MEDHPRIERQTSFAGYEKWIDIDLLDPWLLGHELAEICEQRCQRCGIDWLLAPRASERRPDTQSFHHTPGKGFIHRRKFKDGILHHFGEDAARAKKDYRTELRVDAAA